MSQVVSFIIGAVITSLVWAALCIALAAYFNRRLKRKTEAAVSERDISIEEVKAFLNDMEEKERDTLCWDILKACAEGLPVGTQLNDFEFIEALRPCDHNNCPAYETREDCCTSRVIKPDNSEWCRAYINLNKLCNVESKLDAPDPKILTNKEIELFSQCFNEFIKFLEKKEAK